ncbi:MAG: TetR/AcrR family transcriptional regulator [Clostridia bacterium]|nr:TetR/AcrR family transcriptional regulator [Clostridia bacterium]
MRMTEKQTETLKRNNEMSRENTRQNIQEAFLLLYKQHGNNGFTITDIIRRSGVARSAFYRNYQTKDDILMDIVQKSVDEISDHISPSLSQNWELIFQQAQKNREQLDLLRESELTGMILNKMNEAIPSDAALSNSMILWNGLIYNAILFYASSGYPDPKQAADDILCSMRRMVETYNAQR